MAKYKAFAVYEVTLEATIEADSLEEAETIAENLDGSEFTPIIEDGWRVYHVEEELK